jgi:hypothetical protein
MEWNTKKEIGTDCLEGIKRRVRDIKIM